MTDPAPVRAVLVTGAAGLVGSHLCQAFAQAGWEVRALDRPGSGGGLLEAQLDRPEGALFAAGPARAVSLVAHAAFPGGGHLGEAPAVIRAPCAAPLRAGAPVL